MLCLKDYIFRIRLEDRQSLFVLVSNNKCLQAKKIKKKTKFKQKKIKKKTKNSENFNNSSKTYLKVKKKKQN